MRIAIILIATIFLPKLCTAQSNEGVSYVNWSNEVIYESSKSPSITG